MLKDSYGTDNNGSRDNAYIEADWTLDSERDDNFTVFGISEYQFAVHHLYGFAGTSVGNMSGQATACQVLLVREIGSRPKEANHKEHISTLHNNCIRTSAVALKIFCSCLSHSSLSQPVEVALKNGFFL